MKINLKISLIIISIMTLLLIVPSMVNAAETFTTNDGIVATKIVENTDGAIDFKLTNINLIAGGSYSWSVSTTANANEISDNAWFTLADFKPESKSAVLSLTPSVSSIRNILKSTDVAWLYIKDIKSNKLIVNALKVDLTLPPLKAFKITKNGFYNPNVPSNPAWNISKTYSLNNFSYKLEKITDVNVLNAFTSSNGDLSKLNLLSVSSAPETGWQTCQSSLGYSTVPNSAIPKDDGLYYLWIKAKDTDSKTVFGYTVINFDGDAPVVKSIYVSSPVSGTYKTNQTVKIKTYFSERITGTTVPTLKIRFGEGTQRSLSNGTIKDDYIEYSYNIQADDKGQLATVSLTGGTIKDASGNEAKLSCPIISGNTIKANTENTDNNTTNTQDTTQYVSFPIVIFNGKSNVTIKNYTGTYKLYYQFVEATDTQFAKVEELRNKYKNKEITYNDYLDQYNKLLPTYNESKWIETKDGSFEKNLTDFSGSKKFVLWTKLVMQDKTVYEAEIYTINSNGLASNVPNETDKLPDNDNNNNTSTKDDTVADNKIPQTGATITLTLVIIFTLGLVVFAFKKYISLRDI